MNRTTCVVSVADHAGWAHIVCVAAPGKVPVVVERRQVTTIDAGLPTLPYHHETLKMPESEANALIARVRQSIAACTSRALRDVVTDLSSSYYVAALAIREPTFSELPETVATVRQSYQLQCAADGMMYQFAWCRAAREQDIDVELYRRGEATTGAASRLQIGAAEVELFITSTGRPPGAPWTEEHRRAYAAGIAALAARASGRIELPRRR